MTDVIKAERKRARAERRKAMNDPVANPGCRACKFAYPPIVQMHHIRPLATSPDVSSETVWLCPNCHAMVHEIIKVYFNGHRRIAHKQTRLNHLDYWLSDVCDPKVADRLWDFAKRSIQL